MRKIVLLNLILSFAIAGNVSESYNIKGMHCQYGCASTVKTLMSALEGMQKCEIDFVSSLMTVEYDDSKVNPNLIISTITDNTTYITKKVEPSKLNNGKKSFWDRLKGIFG